MFQQASLEDFRRAIKAELANLAHSARATISTARSEFIAHGAAGGAREVWAIGQAADPAHRDGVAKACRLIADFAAYHGIPVEHLLAVAREELDAFTMALLAAPLRIGRPGQNPSFVEAGDTEKKRFDERVTEALHSARFGVVGGQTVEPAKANVRAVALRLLKGLYDEASNDFRLPVGYLEVAKHIGISATDAQKAHGYLSASHLIADQTVPDGVTLTAAGIYAIEQAVSNPARPTPFFPPYNLTINIGTAINSPIQQGVVGSSQSISFRNDHRVMVGEFIARVRAALPSLELDNEHRATIEADLETVTAQLKKPNPSPGILGEALRSVRTILEGAAGGAIGTVLASEAVQILAAAGLG